MAVYILWLVALTFAHSPEQHAERVHINGFVVLLSCFIISGAMLIGVPTNELQMRPSGLQRPRSVNLRYFSRLKN